MRIYLHLISPALVELLLMEIADRDLHRVLFEAIYGAYKPEKVSGNKDRRPNVTREIVRPSAEEAKGLREIAAKIQELRARAANGDRLDDVGVEISQFVHSTERIRNAIRYLEERMLPGAANRVFGKPTIFYPSATHLSDTNYRDPFVEVLRKVQEAARRMQAMSSSSTQGASSSSSTPAAPAKQDVHVYGTANPVNPNSQYGAAPPEVNYGAAPPEATSSTAPAASKRVVHVYGSANPVNPNAQYGAAPPARHDDNDADDNAAAPTVASEYALVPPMEDNTSAELIILDAFVQYVSDDEDDEGTGATNAPRQ